MLKGEEVKWSGFYSGKSERAGKRGGREEKDPRLFNKRPDPMSVISVCNRSTMQLNVNAIVASTLLCRRASLL
jgi:ribosome assembly protein YihI (activator of Der GTPase)